MLHFFTHAIHNSRHLEQPVLMTQTLSLLSFAIVILESRCSVNLSYVQFLTTEVSQIFSL